MQAFLSNLIGQAPMLIAFLLAVILGIVHMGKHKKAATLVLLGGIVAGAVSLLTAVARPILVEKVYSGEFEDGQSQPILTGTDCCSGLFRAVGVGLIVFGAFAGRQPAEESDDRERRSRRRSDAEPPTARPAKRAGDVPPPAPG